MLPIRNRKFQSANVQERQVRDTVRAGVSALVPSELAPTVVPLPESRRIFWRTYQDWLASADDVEIEQLEFALQPHAQHVRPVSLAISDALRDPTACGQIPISLSAALVTAGWQIEPPRRPSSSRLTA